MQRATELSVDGERLRQLESVYAALDRLALPCVPGLRYSMCALAWRCLPSTLFVQYVERGICMLNDELIVSFLDDLKHNRSAHAHDKHTVRFYLTIAILFVEKRTDATLLVGARVQCVDVCRAHATAMWRRAANGAARTTAAKRAAQRQHTAGRRQST